MAVRSLVVTSAGRYPSEAARMVEFWGGGARRVGAGRGAWSGVVGVVMVGAGFGGVLVGGWGAQCGDGAGALATRIESILKKKKREEEKKSSSSGGRLKINARPPYSPALCSFHLHVLSLVFCGSPGVTMLYPSLLPSDPKHLKPNYSAKHNRRQSSSPGRD